MNVHTHTHRDSRLAIWKKESVRNGADEWNEDQQSSKDGWFNEDISVC